MPIIDADTWQAYTGITVVDPVQLATLSLVCGAVDKLFKNETKRLIERADFTGLMPAAPFSATLRLFYYTPIVISTVQVYYNPQANGDPAAFDDADLLVKYSTNGYTLSPSKTDPLLNSDGLLIRLNGYWGYGYYRPPYSVSSQKVPTPGILKISLTGGYDPIPADLVQAASLAVTKILWARQYGGQKSSESWNDYSYSLPNAMKWVLEDPGISMILDLYRSYGDMI